MAGNGKDKEVDKSPSVSTLKLLGKRLFNSSSHTDNSSLLLSAEQLGNGRSLRKGQRLRPLVAVVAVVIHLRLLLGHGRDLLLYIEEKTMLL